MHSRDGFCFASSPYALRCTRPIRTRVLRSSSQWTDGGTGPACATTAGSTQSMSPFNHFSKQLFVSHGAMGRRRPILHGKPTELFLVPACAPQQRPWYVLSCLWMMYIKEPLLLIGKSCPCGESGFSHSLFVWSFTICLTPYNRK